MLTPTDLAALAASLRQTISALGDLSKLVRVTSNVFSHRHARKAATSLDRLTFVELVRA
jgi:hypothetical protein